MSNYRHEMPEFSEADKLTAFVGAVFAAPIVFGFIVLLSLAR